MIALLYCPVKGNASYPPLSISVLSAYLKTNKFQCDTVDLNKQLFVENKRLARDISHYFAFPSTSSGIIDDLNDTKNIDTIYNFSLFLSILYKDKKKVKTLTEKEQLFVIKLEKEIEQKAEQLIKKGYKHIGFSTYLSNIVYSCLLAQKIKEKKADTVITFGGSSTSYEPIKDFLIETKLADYVLVGEGENSILKLVKDLECNNNPTYSVIYSSNISPAKLEDHEISVPAIKDLDTLPSPDFSNFDLSLYSPSNKNYRILSIATSRGCINSCAYCSETQYWNRYRQRSVAKVIAEIKEGISKFNAKCFYFHDSLINGNIEWLEDLCDVIIKDKLDIHWLSFASIQNLNYKILSKMEAAGCVSLTFGIEHTSKRVLKTVNKPSSLEKAKEVLEAAIKLEIKPTANLIYGLPGEEDEDFLDLFYFISLPQFQKHVNFTFRAFEIRVGSIISNKIIETKDNIRTRTTDFSEFSKKMRDICSEIDIYWLPDSEYIENLQKKTNLVNVFFRARESEMSTQQSVIKRYDTNSILERLISKVSTPIINSEKLNRINEAENIYAFGNFTPIQLEILNHLNHELNLEDIIDKIYKKVEKTLNMENYDPSDIKGVIEKDVIANSIILTQKEILQWN